MLAGRVAPELGGSPDILDIVGGAEALAQP